MFVLIELVVEFLAAFFIVGALLPVVHQVLIGAPWPATLIIYFVPGQEDVAFEFLRLFYSACLTAVPQLRHL